MKHWIISVIAVAAIVMLCLLAPLTVRTDSQEAQASGDPGISCTVIGGVHAQVVCTLAGQTILKQTLHIPPVTLPPVRLPGATVTVRPSPITLPGPTKTVTVTGPTETITEHDNTTRTVTATPTESPSESLSEAPSPIVGPAGQGQAPHDTVTPPGIRIERDEIVKGIGIGLAALIIAGMGFLYLGYILGYKDHQRNERKFLYALRDQIFGKTTER